MLLGVPCTRAYFAENFQPTYTYIVAIIYRPIGRANMIIMKLLALYYFYFCSTLLLHPKPTTQFNFSTAFFVMCDFSVCPCNINIYMDNKKETLSPERKNGIYCFKMRGKTVKEACNG